MKNKLKITYIFFITIIVLNLLALTIISFLVFNTIENVNSSTVDIIKNSSLFELLYKEEIDRDLIRIFHYNNIHEHNYTKLNNIKIDLNSQVKSKYNLNEIFVYTMSNDSLKILISSNSHSKISLEKYEKLKCIYDEDNENVVYYYDISGYYICKFYSKICNDKKIITTIEYNVINLYDIRNYIILYFTLIFITLTSFIIFIIHYIYTKLNVLSLIFYRYLKNDFSLNEKEIKILKLFEKSKLYEISVISDNILYMMNFIKSFTQKIYIEGAKLNSVVEFFKTIFEESPIGIIIINEDNKIVNMNNIAKKLYTKLDELNFTEYLYNNDLNINIDDIHLKIIKKSIGSTKKQNIILIIEDVTKEKVLEINLNEKVKELETANKMLLNYSHILSHDIKSPIRNIKLLIQKFNIEFDIDKKNHYYKLIDKSISKIENLIIDGLNFSKVDNKDLLIESCSVDFLIYETVESLYELINNNNVNLKIIKNSNFNIRCNQSLIINMFQNLITNGIKFNDKEDKNITIEINNYTVSIIDNGIGIEENYITKIFDIFYRGNNEYEGTGLGLAIVKKISERFNINIEIESELNIGTKIILYFDKTS